MKLIPQWAWPLNFFHVHGTYCCAKQKESYLSNQSVEVLFTYEAQSIHEANVLVIWGSISTLLAESLCKHVDLMPKTRFIAHIRGCDARIDSEFSSSSMERILPVNTILSECDLSFTHYQQLIREARQCLRA